MPPKKLTSAQLKRQLRDRNRRFQKLTPAEKRVAIARDVLLQLDLKRIKATERTYFEVPKLMKSKRVTNVWGEKYTDYVPGVEADANLRDCILEADATCHVCALGAIFTSKLLVTNEVEADALTNTGVDEIIDYLDGIFPRDQLDEIESAFECFSDVFADFHRTVKSPTKRMRAIMQNIIDGGGNFDRDKLPGMEINL